MTRARAARRFDIFSRLLQERIICLNGPIADDTSAVVVAQLLYLEAQSVEKPIHLYINSPGGVVTSGLAIYDTMQFIKPPVSTLCVGQACSMASLLLAAGAPGMRRALPNSRVMIHQPSGGVHGQASDIEIHAREILATRQRLVQIYARHTGQPEEAVAAAKERDNFLSPPEAQVRSPPHLVVTRAVLLIRDVRNFRRHLPTAGVWIDRRGGVDARGGASLHREARVTAAVGIGAACVLASRRHASAACT